MSRSEFELINDAFLDYDFGVGGFIPRNLGHEGDFRKLVKVAYAARGELDFEKVEEANLDLDEAMHRGTSRVDHWLDRLQSGDVDPDQLLLQMLEEAREGNQGLNEDPTHIDFRESYAKALEEKIRDKDLSAEDLKSGDQLKELVNENRIKVGAEIAERHGEEYELDNIPEEPKEWYVVALGENVSEADLMERGNLRPELENAAALEFPDAALRGLFDDTQKLLQEKRIIDEPEEAKEITELSGIVEDDYVFGEGEVLRLTDDVQLDDDAELVFEPGSRLDGNDKRLELFGKLTVTGTEEDLTWIDDVWLEHKSGSHFEASYADIQVFSLYKWSDNEGQINVENSFISLHGNNPRIDSNDDIMLKGNIIDNVRLVVSNSDDNVLIQENTFLSEAEISHRSTPFAPSHSEIHDNNFLGDDVFLELSGFFDYEHLIKNSNNYWGTPNEEEALDRIIDERDDLNIVGKVDVADRSDDLTSAPLELGPYQVNPDDGTLI
ncbi:hypothetical protein CKO15_09875 [Halorhodospira abdelmalekii]|uniref:hypothetical protein n=1 Tax=Halorhodospira abdelmalekii TaxID=421629 RepID=UPI001907826F|nr:hypothetical protein [Halorhodospira abdelmalekii]MBK1735586.1 hypothetical protein [Halorhodospira abdelmalekii]